MKLKLAWFAATAWLLCQPHALAILSPFPVYWNVPTEHCARYDITIDVEKFGITQNTNDKFYGDKVTILYHPGRYPVIYNETTYINGGIPQRGNTTLHATTFYERVLKQVPSNFSGIAVIDFETYYPSYAISSAIYRNVSRQWAKKQHPSWSVPEIDSFAEKSFNDSAQLFFQLPLMLGRALRPGAVWGYYHYPYCHNYGPSNPTCKPSVMEMNDMMPWLYDSSTALFPSIYIFRDGWTPESRRLNTKGRLSEAIRVRAKVGKDMPILPYFWYRYHDVDAYLIPIDLVNTLGQTRLLNLEGAVIWGSFNDVVNEEKCLQFQDYVNSTLGPLVVFLQELPLWEVRKALRSRRYAQRLIRLALSKNKEKMYGILRNKMHEH